ARPLGLQPTQQLFEAIPFHLASQPFQHFVPPDRRRYQRFRKADLIPLRHSSLPALRFLLRLNHNCGNSQRSPLWGGVRGGGGATWHHRSQIVLPPSPPLPHKGGGSRPSASHQYPSTQSTQR